MRSKQCINTDDNDDNSNNHICVKFWHNLEYHISFLLLLLLLSRVNGTRLQILMDIIFILSI